MKLSEVIATLRSIQDICAARGEDPLVLISDGAFGYAAVEQITFTASRDKVYLEHFEDDRRDRL